MNGKVSILIANYNNGKYMMDAINSVKRQTYSNWEIIIVDDGSTDNSLDSYKKLEGDEKIHIFFNEKNMGVGYTKCQCVIHANGEICGFLDADDVLVEDAIEIMVAEHEKHPDASIINSTCFDTDENLNVLSVNSYGCALPKGQSFLTYRKGIQVFVTFKRKCYEEIGGIDPIMRGAEDHDLYYKLEEVGKVYFVDKPLYYYRHNTGNNLSYGIENQIKCLSWDIYAMINACKRRGISIEDNALKRVNQFFEWGYYMGADKARESKAYRLGHFLLHPVSSIKKCFNRSDGRTA